MANERVQIKIDVDVLPFSAEAGNSKPVEVAILITDYTGIAISASQSLGIPSGLKWGCHFYAEKIPVSAKGIQISRPKLHEGLNS
jgi:hypothetical protein